MGCFQTEADVVVLMAVASVTIAVCTALMPQYAIISFAAAALYYHVAAWFPGPLCEWRTHYYAVFAAGVVASVAAYIYALDAVVRHAASGGGSVFGRAVDPVEYELWMALQFLSVFFTMLLKSATYVFALRNLLPSKKHPPNRYPRLPVSENPLGRSIEMLAAADDFCIANVPHGGLRKLLCQGDASAADGLPNYALIFATYHVMFRRRDLNAAGELLRVLKDRDLFPDEKEAVEVLEAAYRAAAACDVRAVCEAAAPYYTWSNLFKELVALHFAYDARAADRLKCKTVKAFARYNVYTKRGHYVRYVPDPYLYFIFHAADRAVPICQPRT
jgi:hypothetical protein